MKYKRVICFLVLFVAVLLVMPHLSMAEEYEDDLDQSLLDSLQIEELEAYWLDLGEQYDEYLPDLSKYSLVDMIKNNDGLSISSIVKSLFQYLFHELIVNAKLLGLLMILTLFSVILQSIHSTFLKSTVSKIAYFVVYLVLIYISLKSFQSVYVYTKNTVELMNSFMIALIPLLLSLMAAFGSFLSVSFFHPIIIFLIHLSSILISSFVLPLLYLSALLIVVSHLNINFQATHLAHLFRTISLGSLGVFLTVFLGVMSVQGTVSAVQDGVALKTTKFITGNFIPIVGRTFTDAADTVLSAALLLKNAVGLIGVLVIVLIAVFPAVKIFVIAFVYKLAAALLQPLGNNPVITSLDVISKYILYILACLLTVTLMFFLAIVIMTVISNIPLLLK